MPVLCDQARMSSGKAQKDDDYLEEANAKRTEYLAQLATLRKKTAPALMQELGLKQL